MNTEFFLARRLYFKGEKNKRVSGTSIRIAMAGVAVGIVGMILSVCIVIGFKHQVREKVIGFGAHLQITSYNNQPNFETSPLAFSDSLLRIIRSTQGVRHAQPFITTPGVIKTHSDFQGIVLKGIGNDYDTTFIHQHLIAGGLPSDSGNNEVVISQHTAKRLHLQPGDSFLIYFVKDHIAARKLHIVGIYETGLEEHDRLLAITRIPILQRINKWLPDQYSGVEVSVNDIEQSYAVKHALQVQTSLVYDRQGTAYHVSTAEEMRPDIFGWLQLLDMNTIVIIVLMLVVSGVTMISGLLIIILEHTQFIGLLKALGSTNIRIRRIFLYFASFIILKGMLLGNIIGIGLCWLQLRFGIIKLDASTYYLSEVPIELNGWYIVVINLGAFTISLLMMIVPSLLISRISPAKAIKFE